tara:strand:+ start:181 stop:549 length:369 start_codon:yes stop_codon:yes gene_type:complete
MKYKTGLNKDIVLMYSEALDKATRLGINLKNIYENDVLVREEYGKKIDYAQILSADSSSSLNGFIGIINELKSIEMIMQLSNTKSYKELDEVDKDIIEQSLSLISSFFEHISKWVNIEQDNQ